MKKLFFFVAFVAMSILSMAQKNQLVWLNGRLQYGDSLESIDPSIYNLMEDVDTLPLLLPRTLLKVERDTIVRNVYIYDTIVDVKTQIIHETVYITGPCPETPVTPEDSTSNTENGYEYVDLGLSVKWAMCNIGSKTIEDPGWLFAWGETMPKISYVWESYSFYEITKATLSKYCSDSVYGNVDWRIDLEPEDDAATVNMGGSWRMPTYEEINELKSLCHWERAIVNGKNGYKITGSNGNSIFLPATGYKSKEPFQLLSPNGGYYWSKTVNSNNMKAISITFGPHKSDFLFENSERYLGYAIRPVVIK